MVISLSQQHLHKGAYVSFVRFNGLKQIWHFPHSIQFCSLEKKKLFVRSVDGYAVTHFLIAPVANLNQSQY